MNPAAIRFLNQQLVAPQCSDPVEVVNYMGAIQAQEYRMMRWAVERRTRRSSHKAFEKAFDKGRIIRLHLMRGTWQLVFLSRQPATLEDFVWWSGLNVSDCRKGKSPKHWTGIDPNSAPDDLLKKLTRNSYEIVKDKYTKK